jgi:hypothetical protein
MMDCLRDEEKPKRAAKTFKMKQCYKSNAETGEIEHWGRANYEL